MGRKRASKATVAEAEWCVEIPIAGSMSIVVKASSESEAMERAWESYEEGTDAFEVTWDALEVITEGNVCHAPCNQISATCLDEEGGA